MAQDMRVGVNIDVLAKDAKAQLQSFAGFSKQQFESVRNAGMQLAAAGAAVTGFFAAATKASMVQEKAERKVELQFGKNAAALKAYAAEVQQQTRYGDELVLQAMAIGGTYQGLRGDMEGATKAAVNMAEAYGMDVIQAMHMLGKASGGMVSNLRRVGVMVDLNDFKARGMAAVYDQVSKETKDMAFAIDDASKAYDQAKNAAGDLMEVIGSAVAPMFAALAQHVRVAVEWLQKFVATDAGRTAVQWAAGLGAAALAAGAAMIVVGQLGIALTGLKARYAAAAIAAKASWAAMAGPVGLVIGGIAALAIAIGHATKKYRENARAAREAADAQLEAEQLGQRGMQEKIQNLDREIIVRKRVVEAIGEQLEAERRAAQELTKKYKPAELLTGGEGSEEYAKTAQRIQELSERHRMAAGDLSKMQVEAEVTRQRLALLGEEAKAAGKNVEDMGKSTEQAAAAVKAAAEAVTAYADATKLAVEASDALADAKVNLQDAVNAYDKTMRDADASVVASERAIGTAAKDGAIAIAQAVRDANDARRDAARNAEQSARRIEEAESNLTRSLRDASKSRRDMQQAETDQLKKLEDAYDGVKNGVFEAAAAADKTIESAQKALSDEYMRQYKDDYIAAAAELGKSFEKQAKEEWDRYEKTKRTYELEKALDDAKIEGAKKIADAQAKADEKIHELEEQRIRLLEDNAIREEDIQRNIASAQQAVTDARAAAAEQATTDAERIDAANKKVAQSFADAQKAVQEAVEKHKEAIAAYAEAEVEAHKRVEDAVKSLRRAEVDLMNAVTARSNAQTAARTAGAGQEIMGVDRRMASERNTSGVSVPGAQSRSVVINIGGNVYGDRQLEEKIVQGVAQGMRQAALSG